MPLQHPYSQPPDTPSSASFLHLPPELRLQIYANLHPYTAYQPILPDKALYYETYTHPMSQTCRLIRSEVQTALRIVTTLSRYERPVIAFRPDRRNTKHDKTYINEVAALLEALDAGRTEDQKWLRSPQSRNERSKTQTSDTALRLMVAKYHHRVFPNRPEKYADFLNSSGAVSTPLHHFFEQSITQLRTLASPFVVQIYIDTVVPSASEDSLSDAQVRFFSPLYSWNARAGRNFDVDVRTVEARSPPPRVMLPSKLRQLCGDVGVALGGLVALWVMGCSARTSLGTVLAVGGAVYWVYDRAEGGWQVAGRRP